MSVNHPSHVESYDNPLARKYIAMIADAIVDVCRMQKITLKNSDMSQRYRDRQQTEVEKQREECRKKLRKSYTVDQKKYVKGIIERAIVKAGKEGIVHMVDLLSVEDMKSRPELSNYVGYLVKNSVDLDKKYRDSDEYGELFVKYSDSIWGKIKDRMFSKKEPGERIKRYFTKGQQELVDYLKEHQQDIVTQEINRIFVGDVPTKEDDNLDSGGGDVNKSGILKVDK